MPPGTYIIPSSMTVLQRLRERKEWRFFAALPRADRPLAFVWWAVVVLHGVVPVLFAVATGVLVAAVQRGEPLAAALRSPASCSCCCRC